VVVIGAGVVGASLVDELSARGWSDITLVEQGPLPAAGGSSSHAPGLVFQTNGAKVMTQLARYTVRRLTELSSFLAVGSLEVATTPERLTELHRRHGWATAWGLESEVLTAEETLARHDLLDPAVLGALHVPSDGLALAVPAIEAQLDLARGRGVRILDRRTVTGINVTGGRVTAVHTDQGELPADIVVCCAGIWGPRVARMVGLRLPLTPLAHQFAWSTPLPELSVAASRPILRHQGADLYLRERGDQLGIGYYGHTPLPVDADEIRPYDAELAMPSVLPFTPDDFAPGWVDAQALIPALRKAGIADAMNGLFSFTTDNFPLLGEWVGVKGFWVAEAVWVTHSAGVGRAMAEWLTDGYCTSFDLHECDLNRFEPHQLAPAYVRAKNCQNYVEVYDALHPLEPMLAPRPLRTSPFYPRQQALDAYFLEATGWERPQWYDANSVLLGQYTVDTPNAWAATHWSPVVGAEALHTRAAVALYDMTTLKRLEVSGSGAARFLQWMTTGDVDTSVGSVTYCLLLDTDGGIRSDITVARLGLERYQVGVNGNLDLGWLAGHAPADVVVRDLTAGTCCIGLWGPLAREVLAPLAADPVGNDALRYFRGLTTYVGSVPVTALRLSYVGELGWELYTTADLGLTLWDALWEAGQAHGIIAAGRGAFTSLRLEKGYRSFGADMTNEHDPYEAGLGFAVKLGKGDFLGRAALVKRAEAAPRRRLTCLTIEDPAAVVLGREPVYDGTGCIGYVTSAAFGYTIGRPIAYAWLPAAVSTPGRAVQIGYFDERIDAVVAEEPLYDPKMARLRS
jgi:glycine cleavage system aminomethyltransferase T/glycine/D-amino acid oxidase-like deaminating enzyme